MAHARRVLPLGKEHKFILTQEDLEKGLEMVKKAKPVSVPSQPPMGMYT